MLDADFLNPELNIFPFFFLIDLQAYTK